MANRLPSKVLITGGREVGGLNVFAEGLAEGFRALGIFSQVMAPRRVFGMVREMRDPGIMKILSTSSVFAAPVARRAICMSHGVPRADAQGWPTMLGVVASYKLANRCRDARFVAVSDYTAVHLRSLFNLRVDAVIRNPMQSLFFERYTEGERRYLTFAGRLISAKNAHRLLPAMCQLQKEHSELRVCVIGDGPMREELQASFPGVEFTGNLSSIEVRGYLRKTKIFASGTEMEAFGIGYVEALSQGCVVAMPACGGGLEIAPHQIGKRIHLLPLSWDPAKVACVFRGALCASATRAADASADLAAYEPKVVAQRYLNVSLELER